MTTKRLGLVIDLDRCIGCWTCATVCKAENNVALGNWWNRVLSPEGAQFGAPGAPVVEPEMTFMPVMCMHCENPPCCKVCPVGATYKRSDGIVMQDYDQCVGCRTCMAACPYNAKVFNWSDPEQVPSFNGDHVGNYLVAARPRHVVEKCTFCVERVDRGELPACIDTCPEQARTFGDLNDPNSEVSRLIRERRGYQFKGEFGTNPNVYYLPPRRQPKVPQVVAAITPEVDHDDC